MQLDHFFEPSIFPGTRLTLRQRQVLERILLGDGEKQIAMRLRISQHTVHVYVKWIYQAYRADGRSDLMAKFIPRKFIDAICRPN
jgi:DNA-binding CsgD family transcriptional regulator